MAERRKHNQSFGILDIGTSKIAAAVVVAQAQAQGAGLMPRVVGMGVQRSKGLKAGVLIDINEAEGAARAAIAQAEREAGVRIDGVTVSVACGRLTSQHFTAKADIANGVVTEDDVTRMMTGGRAYVERHGRALLHLNPLAYQLDGSASIQDPKGFAARQMSAQLHAVVADDAPLRNVLLLIERCHLACDGLVAAPYASALAATTAEEREFGVTCIDFGAETTSYALFSEGRFIGADVVPVGSQRISHDIARALQTPLVEAERIKSLYGTLISAQSDEHEAFSYPLLGDEEGATHQATKAMLTAIIRPRVAQILSLVQERLAQNGGRAYAGDKVVLTGGSSQLLGAAEFAANQLGRPVRLGRPIGISGWPVAMGGPQLATLTGLAYAALHSGDVFGGYHTEASTQQGYLGRVSDWLKTGF
jgi:cell division protein FtsA